MLSTSIPSVVVKVTYGHLTFHHVTVGRRMVTCAYTGLATVGRWDQR